MTKKTSKTKLNSDGQDTKQILLEIIAANTMCTRKMAGVAAKIGMTFLMSSLLVVIAIVIVAVCSLFFGESLFNENAWIPIVAGVIIVINWVAAVFYSVSLLGDLDDTVELIAQNEEEFLGDDEDEDQDDKTE